MIKSLIGFVVLMIGVGVGYFVQVNAQTSSGMETYPTIEPVEFVVPGASLGSPQGGGSCG